MIQSYEQDFLLLVVNSQERRQITLLFISLMTEAPMIDKPEHINKSFCICAKPE